jgi:hypothetical protein
MPWQPQPCCNQVVARLVKQPRAISSAGSKAVASVFKIFDAASKISSTGSSDCGVGVQLNGVQRLWRRGPKS